MDGPDEIQSAASLSEGLAETLSVTRLGVTGSLLKTVMSTNPVESMFEFVREHARTTSSAGRTAACACGGRPPACSPPATVPSRDGATTNSHASLECSDTPSAPTTQPPSLCLPDRIIRKVHESSTANGSSFAESVNGLYKWELFHRPGPWTGLDDVEFTTLSPLDWLNQRLLQGEITNGPGYAPAALETDHYRQHVTAVTVATQWRQPPPNPGRSPTMES